MRRTVEFRLSMPGRGSAVSSSFGSGRNYVIYRTVAVADLPVLLDGKPKATWWHRWDDGWVAQINARVLEPRERRSKSDGFGGYDWMVDNILRYGSPYTTGTAQGMAPA